eukprot:scaffold6326_cov92-Skeletonema_marinoi.AAC.2
MTLCLFSFQLESKGGRNFGGSFSPRLSAWPAREREGGPSAGLVLRGWMRPEVEGIGSEPNRQRPGKVPRQKPWGFR